MNNLIKTTYWIFILWGVLVAVLNLNGNITFGHGLGDVYYLLLLLFFEILVSIITFKIPKNSNKQTTAILFLLFVLAIIISFTLKLTIFRGPEYPWDGHFSMF